MTQTIDRAPCKALAAFAWLPGTRSGLDSRDTLAVLAAALGPIWSVHREADYGGEVSIVVLPDDGYVEPAFLLYEKDGLVRVVTFSGDEWIDEESFSDIYAAVAAIIARTISIAPTGQACGEATTSAAA